MANRPQFTSFLFPLIIPTLAFFIAYFLFPSFSKEFFGASVKGNSLEYSATNNEQKQVAPKKAEAQNNADIPNNAEMLDDVVFIPKNEQKQPSMIVPSDVKTIKNPEFNTRGNK